MTSQEKDSKKILVTEENKTTINEVQEPNFDDFDP
jgi:hypothetical protein